MFSRIEPRTKEHEIVEQLRTLIYRGELTPGSKLPPERGFAKALGVGRHTLRVALNRLAAQGFVEIRKYEGTFVKSVTAVSLGEPLKDMLEVKVRNIESFLEVRSVLESWAAGQAAERATPEQIEKVRRALEQMKAAQNNSDLVAKADLEFHMGVAEAAGNPILSHIMSNFVNLMHETRGLRLLVTDPIVTQVIRTQHEEIYMAIRGRDPELASEKMRAHLEFILTTVRQILSPESPVAFGEKRLS